MNRFASPDDFPWPEILAAYLDGELDDSQRDLVEIYLRAHPEAEAELSDQEWLSRCHRDFWQAVEPVPPSPVVWDRVWRQIHQRVLAHQPVDTRRPTSLGRVSVTILVAASLLMAMTLAWIPPRTQGPEPRSRMANALSPLPPNTLAGMDPIELARPDEVEILSIDGFAHEQVILGESPLPELIEWASPADVRLVSIESHPSGTAPDMHTPPDSNLVIAIDAPRP